MFRMSSNYITDTPDGIKKLRKALDESDAVVIGAGAGLSTSAGFIYTGERLQKYFGDFVAKYNIPDMYSGGFMVMQLPPEMYWAYWSRYIYINRYMNPPKPVYEKLFELVKDKDYFVLT
ncbi:MAG: Sir2 silent information regulator family NAD-dependent deacetylase, partial [Clostridia bacterium]|nr:Sir2 silent information regulator family NAD-dependent deacetylase [Clostridia bacterium]